MRIVVFYIFSIFCLYESVAMHVVPSDCQRSMRLINICVDDYAVIHFFSDNKKKVLAEDIKTQPKAIVSDALLDALCGIRAKITQNKQNKETIISKINVLNITEEMKVLTEAQSMRFLSFENSHSDDFCNEVVKFALLASTTLEWGKLIKTFRVMYPDGIFQDFSFEDAVFIMFLCPEYPSFFYKIWHSDTYRDEARFYTNCLAGAIKKWMEVIMSADFSNLSFDEKSIPLAQVIILQYLQLTENTVQHEKKD